MLLSFAQFEREVTGERIRDKIAASKARGIWMGGNVPLGYDLGERRLLMNGAEAGQVRHIFSRYLELGSGIELMKELRREGIVSKRWTSRAGKVRGGAPFSCGALYYLLQNRLYLGEIVHRGVSHRGEHEAIVSQELFDGVQGTLLRRRQNRPARPPRSGSCVLAGLVRDPHGRQMTTSFSYGRGGRLYRYYVCGSLDPSRPESAGAPVRSAAAPLERLVVEAMGRLLQRQITLAGVLPLLIAVELHERSIQLVVHRHAFAEPHEPLARVASRIGSLVEPDRLVADDDCVRLIMDRRPGFRGGKANGSSVAPVARGDAAALLRSAHRLLELHSISPLEPSQHIHASAPAWQRQRRQMALGLLAPALQKAILQGVLTDSAELLLNKPPPLAWADQELATQLLTRHRC